MNASRAQLFGRRDPIDLNGVLHIPPDITSAVYKCRVIYTEHVQNVEFAVYVPKIINSVRLMQGDDIEYSHKYLEKTPIEQLRVRSGADDILIVKENRITDASFANVVLYNGTVWMTPASPLLRGTKRQLLLERGVIQEEDITVNNLKQFQKVGFINAMIDIGTIPPLGIEQILP